jgi:hypothetical protein
LTYGYVTGCRNSSLTRQTAPVTGDGACRCYRADDGGLIAAFASASPLAW